MHLGGWKMFKMRRHTQVILMRFIAIFMFIVTVTVSTIAIYASVPSSDYEAEQENDEGSDQNKEEGSDDDASQEEGSTPVVISDVSPAADPVESPTDDGTPDETPNETPGETPDETPSETPGETPDETPSETPDETPSETPDGTPSTSPDATPDVSPSASPSATPSATPDTADEDSASIWYSSKGISGTGLDEVTVSFDTSELNEEDTFDLVLSVDAEDVSSNHSFTSSGDGCYEISGLGKDARDITFGNLNGEEFSISAKGDAAAFDYYAFDEVSETEAGYAGKAEITVVSEEAEAEEPETEEEELTEQKIITKTDDGAWITVGGLLPEGATVNAVPVSVEIEGKVVLAAYDITILDADGAEYQITESVTVSITTSALKEANNDKVSIYHMEDVDSPAQKVADVDVNYNKVSFEAEGFSIYAATEPAALQIETGDGICINDRARYNVTIQNYTSDTAVSREQEFTFNLEFSFDDSTSYVPNTTNNIVYFDIPDVLTELTSSQGMGGDVLAEDRSTIVGYYQIEGNRIVFVYTDEEWLKSHPSEIKGYFTFSAKVKTTSSTNQSGVTIAFGGESKDIVIKFEEGTVDAWKTCGSANDKGVIDCQITFDVKDKDVTNVTLTDTLGSNLEFVPGSFRLNGEAISDLKSGEQTNLGDLKIGKYTLTYQIQVIDLTKLDDTQNHIKWNWDGNTKGDKEQTAYIHLQGSNIDKNGWQDGDSIKWFITVTPAYHASVEGTTIEDTLGEGLEYEGEFRIYECDVNGNWSENSNYVEIPIQDGATSFSHTFSQNDGMTYQAGRKYVIYYLTKVKDQSVNATYSNTVNDELTREVKYTSSSAEAQADIVSKSGEVSDADTKTITWKITVDPSGYAGEGTITDLTLEDQNPNFDYNGYLFGSSLTVKDESENEVAHTLTWADDMKSFKIVFAGEFTKDSPKIYVTYDAKPTKDFTGYVDNRVDSSYKINGTPKTETDSANVPITSATVNGEFSKAGQMNGMEAEWTIVANQTGNETHRWHAGTLVGTYTIEDYLPEGMGYIEGSATIALGDYVPWDSEPPTSWEFDSVAVEGRKIVFVFTIPNTHPENSSFVEIKYRTQITDLSAAVADGDTYKFMNRAQFAQGDTTLGTAEDTVTYTKKILDKSGVLASTSEAYNRINYSIVVNYEGTDLVSDSERVTLVDTLDTNVTLDLNSVKVVDFNSGTEISDYTVAYNSQGQLILELPDSHALKVIYGVVVAGQEGEKVTVSNHAELRGVDLSETTASNTITIKESGAGITGKSGSISLKKFDGNSIQTVLEGAEFKLVRVEDSGEEVVATGATGSDGILTFEKETNGDSLKLNKLYYYVETKAPVGYQLDDTKYYFILKGEDVDAYNAVIAKYHNIDLHTLTGGQTINVANVQKTVEVSGTKTWADNNDQDGKRPTSITIELYKTLADSNVEEYVTSKEVSGSGNNWSWSFGDLPMYDNGTEIIYTVKEEKVPGYNEPVITGNAEAGFTITNTQTVSISGTKTWEDDANRDKIRPTSITVNLLADNVKIGDKTVTAADNWSWDFGEWPKYKNVDGKAVLINYTITENAVGGYTASPSGYDITNTHTPDKTYITVVKSWKDNDNQDGIRPSSIIVQLYADGEAVEGVTAELNESNNWTYTFENLNEKNAGEVIEYTVKETKVPDGYESADPVLTSETKTVTITNTHVPATINIQGSKTWDDGDNQDGKRPKSITVKLTATADDVYTNEYTTTTDESKNWEWKFENLPENYKGNKITYTISEDSVAGYEITGITGTQKTEDGSYEVIVTDREANCVITNKHIPETFTIKGTKVWEGIGNRTGVQPDEVIVKLTATADGGYKEVRTTKVSASTEWKWEFEGLPKYHAGAEIHYDVDEVVPDGYSKNIHYDEVAQEYVITNTYTPGETSRSVTKEWNDNDDRDALRQPVSVQLLADGVACGDAVELNAENDWSYTWTGLDEKKNGQLITYTIREITRIPGYTTEYSENTATHSFTITNSHEYARVEIKGTKVWNDADNQDGMRPTSITLYLKEQGVTEPLYTMTVTPNENGDWSWSFGEQPKYKNVDGIAVPIEYTVEEETSKLEGYTSKLDGNIENGFTITNTHETKTVTIEGTKTWVDSNNSAGNRPTSITIRLWADGNEKASKEVCADADNKWSWNFGEWPKYKNVDGKGVLINYTITEDAVEGYTSTVSGYNVTNKYAPDTTNIQVTKSWDDVNNQDAIRPTYVTVQLQESEDSGKTWKLVDGKEAILSEQNRWTYNFTGLEKKRNGVTIMYDVVEDAVKGYEATYDRNATAKTVAIKNSHVPETVSISGTKTWVDDKNRDNKRPGSITIRLYADGAEVAHRTVTEANNWSWDFGTWSKYRNDNGVQKEIKYEIKEDAVEGYKSNVSGYGVTNTHVPETITVEGTKTWVDNDNEAGARPASITINLLADGKKIDSQTIKPDANGNWPSWKFENLPKYAEGSVGQEIEYTISEDNVTDYSPKVEGYNVTNTYMPETTMVTVTKKWVDNEDAEGLRPEAIWVQLYKDKLFDTAVGNPVRLSAENGWSYTWNELPKRGFLLTINYTVKELGVEDADGNYVAVTGYTSTTSETTTNNIVIINTLTTLPTPTPGETPAPTGTPDTTPETTPDTTPEATPDVTPGTTPDVTPSATPGATPEATPNATPEATPNSTPTVDRTPAPTATPTREVLGAFRVKDQNVAVLGARRGLDYAVLGKRRRPSTGDSTAMLWWILTLGFAAGTALSSAMLLHLKKEE